MIKLASHHRTLFPGKIFHFPGKLSRHRSPVKKGAKQANKPIKEKKRKEKVLTKWHVLRLNKRGKK